jgi:hypothetical protein
VLGDFTAGKTVIVRFNTHKADGTPITLAGTPAISVYKNSTTESTAGVTLTVDYDSRTGLHHVAIDTSTDGTFYAAGSDFDVVIGAGTVDSISVVGTVVGSFSLANRAALRPTVADRTLDVTSTGAAGVDWGNVENPTTTLGLTGTTISTGQTISAVSGAVGSVTGAVGSVTGSVASVTGNVGGSVGSVVGAVGSVTGNVGGNVTGSVGSVASGGITSASFASGAITATAIAADAIGASELATDAVTEIVAGVWNAARATYTSAGSFGQGVASVQGNVTGSVASVASGGITTASFAAGAINAAAIAADAIGASELAADAVTEIAAAVADVFTGPSDTVQASPTPTTTEFAGSSSLSTTDDIYNGCTFLPTSGVLDGIPRKITDYVGSTRTFTVSPAYTSAPASGVTFRIVGRID